MLARSAEASGTRATPPDEHRVGGDREGRVAPEEGEREHRVCSQAEGAHQDQEIARQARAGGARALPHHEAHPDQGQNNPEHATQPGALQAERHAQQQAPHRRGRHHEGGVGAARQAQTPDVGALVEAEAHQPESQHGHEVGLLRAACRLEEEGEPAQQQPGDCETQRRQGERGKPSRAHLTATKSVPTNRTAKSRGTSASTTAALLFTRRAWVTWIPAFEMAHSSTKGASPDANGRTDLVWPPARLPVPTPHSIGGAARSL